MYDHMRADSDHLLVDRGLALHKMIRLITLATGGHGYLNFMGNEFGHPEWIDFPREGNQWSYHYARRQWDLADDPELKYRYLSDFDRAMIRLARKRKLYDDPYLKKLWENEDDKVLIFIRSDTLFAFNFHPESSYSDYVFEAQAGNYQMILTTEDPRFGGHGRLTPDQLHFTFSEKDKDTSSHRLSLYLPSRTAVVLSHTTS